MTQRQQALFIEAIKAKDTKRLYKMSIERFQKETGIKAIEKVKPKLLQQKIIDYTIQMKNEGRSYSSQNNMLAALQKYALVYDIPNINFKHIRQFMGENIANHHDQPYTKEQLQKMIEIATPRMKAIILLMLSSGCRVGALPSLRVGDLKKHDKEGLYEITVYATSKKDAYTTFCSVEATRAIDKMVELRKAKGESITPDSPLFRSDLEGAGVAKAMTKNAINQRMFALLRQAGIRSPNKDRYQRQGTMLTHSFRKLANTAFVRAGLKPIVTEKLLGHNIGLQANYLRLGEDELLQEYVKAIDLLTVSEEKQLHQEVEKLKADVSDLDLLKKMHLDTKLRSESQIEMLQDTIANLSDQLMGMKEEVKKLKITKDHHD